MYYKTFCMQRQNNPCRIGAQAPDSHCCTSEDLDFRKGGRQQRVYFFAEWPHHSLSLSPSLPAGSQKQERHFAVPRDSNDSDDDRHRGRWDEIEKGQKRTVVVVYSSRMQRFPLTTPEISFDPFALSLSLSLFHSTAYKGTDFLFSGFPLSFPPSFLISFFLSR